jgi:hypothetical protein
MTWYCILESKQHKKAIHGSDLRKLLGDEVDHDGEDSIVGGYDDEDGPP